PRWLAPFASLSPLRSRYRLPPSHGRRRRCGSPSPSPPPGRVRAAARIAVPPPAKQWRTKPVRLVVPFPPGGSVDPLARLLGTKLSEALGQQFIVENKPGASGSIGTAFAAKSPPDGYTFVVVFDTHAVNPTLIPNMPFYTVRALVPVIRVVA